MARINIEDKFWIEIVNLAIALGDQDKAVGMAVRFFRVAQECHKAGKLISEEEFRRSFHEALVGPFAERVDGGVRAAGAEKHFGWLAKKVEAGRKGGRSTAEAKTKHLKQNKAKPSKRSITEASPSSSLSFSSSESPSSGLPQAEPAAPNDPDLNRQVWDAYSLAYLNRYGTEPVRNAKVNALVAQVVKRLGSEAPDVARFYVGHDKSFYVGKMHDIGLLVSDAEALRTQWATNSKVSTTQAHHLDQSSAMKEQLKRFGGLK